MTHHSKITPIRKREKNLKLCFSSTWILTGDEGVMRLYQQTTIQIISGDILVTSFKITYRREFIIKRAEKRTMRSMRPAVIDNDIKVDWESIHGASSAPFTFSTLFFLTFLAYSLIGFFLLWRSHISIQIHSKTGTKWINHWMPLYFWPYFFPYGAGTCYVLVCFHVCFFMLL